MIFRFLLTIQEIDSQWRVIVAEMGKYLTLQGKELPFNQFMYI